MAYESIVQISPIKTPSCKKLLAQSIIPCCQQKRLINVISQIGKKGFSCLLFLFDPLWFLQNSRANMIWLCIHYSDSWQVFFTRCLQLFKKCKLSFNNSDPTFRWHLHSNIGYYKHRDLYLVFHFSPYTLKTFKLLEWLITALTKAQKKDSLYLRSL